MVPLEHLSRGRPPTRAIVSSLTYLLLLTRIKLSTSAKTMVMRMSRVEVKAPNRSSRPCQVISWELRSKVHASWCLQQQVQSWQSPHTLERLANARVNLGETKPQPIPRDRYPSHLATLDSSSQHQTPDQQMHFLRDIQTCIELYAVLGTSIASSCSRHRSRPR